MISDDLEVFTSARQERRARIAGSLSIAAIVMLLITSFTLARNPTTGAAQLGPHGREQHAALIRVNPSESSVAASASTINAAGQEASTDASRGVHPEAGAVLQSGYAHTDTRTKPGGGNAPAPAAPSLDCLRLRNGEWLRLAVLHDGDRMRQHECIYGHSAGQRFVQ